MKKKPEKKKLAKSEIRFKNAKTNFERAFSSYGNFLLKYYMILVEKPEFYYSEKLAKKGLHQVQTKYYLEKLKEMKKIQRNKLRGKNKYKIHLEFLISTA